MIVWGGTNDGITGLDTGGKYNPATDTWTPISTVGAPSARFYARAGWIGLTVNRMIVWGGTPDFTNGLSTGGVYDPALNSWTATTVTGAPTARFNHTMVRSSSTIIVWGGTPDDNTGLNTGGVYDPVADSWTATAIDANTPSARFRHTAVRRGNSETMIVWGGTPDGTSALNTGGEYDPAADSWTATTTTGAPSARADHRAVFVTNTGVIVWGGTPDGNTSLNTGGIYHAAVDTWTATTTTNAPSARALHTMQWTGTEMIVWGGTPDYTSTLNTGGRYNPATDTWTATTTTNAPSARAAHGAEWTDTEMIVWGGTPDFTSPLNTGGRYTP
jgi:N-acetylneuraminic acid mutarotase